MQHDKQANAKLQPDMLETGLLSMQKGQQLKSKLSEPVFCMLEGNFYVVCCHAKQMQTTPLTQVLAFRSSASLASNLA